MRPLGDIHGYGLSVRDILTRQDTNSQSKKKERHVHGHRQIPSMNAPCMFCIINYGCHHAYRLTFVWVGIHNV